MGTLTIGNFEASKYPKPFNPSEPGRGRGQVVRGGSVGLNHLELMSSSSAGMVPCVVSSSDMFRRVEPLFRTVVQHREPGLRWSLTCGSTLLNLLEPLISRGNKDHRIISHEFVVVQHIRTCSNHSATRGARPVAEFDSSSGWCDEFSVAQLFRTCSNHSIQHRKQGLWQSLT